MKQAFVVLFILIQHFSFAQVKKSNSTYSMPSRDYVMIQFGYNGLQNIPDSVTLGGVGRTASLYVCYDFPIQKSNFSFAAGVGISSSNFYLKNQQIIINDTTTQIQFVPENIDYKKYKYNLTYVEAPFELRYFENKSNRNEGIKAAIGLKVGTILSAHTKAKYTINNKPVIEKVNTKRFIETWRYSLTARVGWGNFSIYGQYAINNLFKLNTGPVNVKPYQIGICISGL